MMCTSLSFDVLVGPWSQLRELHNKLFQTTDASSQWFTWYMTRIGRLCGDSHQTRAYVILDRGEVIGSWCVEPKLFTASDDRVLNVGRCFAVGIHPNYRRQNLFVELSQHAIQEERALGRYEYILGFPQDGRPVVGGHLKAGWHELQAIDVLETRPSELDRVSLRTVDVITDFQLTDSVAYRGSFLETPEYRNLRWHDHPDCSYICLGRGSSYVVLKPYHNMCHVLDVNGTHEDVQHLLRATKTLAYRHGWERVTSWGARNDHLVDDFRIVGFHPSGDQIRMLAVDIVPKGPLALDVCHLMMGVEEMY